VIWMKVGNCSTTSIEQLFFGVAPLLSAFLAQDSESYLVLSRSSG
jgi:predicted nuclease of predicted toxin-antitoxin system